MAICSRWHHWRCVLWNTLLFLGQKVWHCMLHVLAVDSKTKNSLSSTTIFAWKSSLGWEWLPTCASLAFKVNIKEAIKAIFSAYVLPSAYNALRFHFFRIYQSFKEVAGKAFAIVMEATVAIPGGVGTTSVVGRELEQPLIELRQRAGSFEKCPGFQDAFEFLLPVTISATFAFVLLLHVITALFTY